MKISTSRHSLFQLVTCHICMVLFSQALAGSTFAQQSKTDSKDDFFEICVIDEETKRGVPMIQLTLVDGTEYITDSAGRVAFKEPGLFGKKVFFHVSGHGYEYPADGFGSRGFQVQITPGKSKTVKVKRINIAERLYRITGRGIYRDSILLDKPVPIKKPLLNGDVVGQDTVQMATYKKKLYWFWGDTNRPQYPLGQFKTSGATSEIPTETKWNPSDGIDLTYFLDKDGFSRQMTPVKGKGAVWLHGLTVLPDVDGKEFMFGHYVRLLDLGSRLEHGLVRFNDKTQTFEKWIEFDLNAKLYPQGVSLFGENEQNKYIYFCRPFPFIRVEAKPDSITNPKQYEAYTCLKPGARYQKGVDLVERDKNGQAVWAWKKNTDFIDAERMFHLMDGGYLKESESKFLLRDPQTREPIFLKGGSVHWNKYRNRWVMIGLQIGGKTSFYGEVWYAESDKLEGPWLNPRHVVTHNKYSFYNPSHHPQFDQEIGRFIYFDGTFATTFSKSPRKIPRYDYNQIMYRLDLKNSKLNLPKVKLK